MPCSAMCVDLSSIDVLRLVVFLSDRELLLPSVGVAG